MTKTNRTSNGACASFVRACQPFVANQLYGEWRGDLYVVFSYGSHWPLYICKNMTWYVNDDRASKTTSKHRGQAHPGTNCISRTCEQMKELLHPSSVSQAA